MGKKKMNWQSLIFVVIGALCIGIALYGLYGIYKDYKISDDIYEQVTSEYVEIQVAESETPEIPWYELAAVNVADLKSKYADVVGWIYFEDGSISYPLVQGVDNNQYLHTTYDGVAAKAGSIFLEATHSDDFSNTHTLIYGHNMKNLSMFGKLKYYKTKEGYYDGHEYFLVYRENEILRYKIFSYQEVPEDSYIYTEYFNSAKQLADRLKPTSMVNANLEISDEDRIVTLSTCTAADDERFIVSAVLVESYNLVDRVLIDE